MTNHFIQKMRVSVSGASISLALICSAPSATRAETLLDALAAAYSYNPQLDTERANLRATDEDVARAISGYRPTITFQGDIGRERQDFSPDLGSFSGSGSTTPSGYAAQITQPLFRGFRTTNAVNAAEASVRAGRETLRNTEQQILLEAVTAYANVVRDEAIVKLREQNLSFLSTELRATQDRFKVGEVTRTDVAQSEAQRSLGVSDLELAKANLKSSRADYERVTGQPPKNLVRASAKSKLVPGSLQDAIAIGTQENPAVVGALYSEQAADYQVRQIRGELLPEAQLEGTYSDRFEPSTTLERSQTASIVGRVTVPIYPGGGETHARVRQAKQTHLARMQSIETARSQTQSQVVSAWAQLLGARAQLQSDRAQIKSNEIALQGNKEEERVGQRTLIEVLNAQQTLISSQIRLEQTLRDEVVDAYTLISAIGRLSVAEIGAAGEVYDPQVHYNEVRRKWWGIDITQDDGSRTTRDGRLEVEPWAPHVERVPIK